MASSALDKLAAEEVGYDLDDFALRHWVEDRGGVEEAQWLLIWRGNGVWV